MQTPHDRKVWDPNEETFFVYFVPPKSNGFPFSVVVSDIATNQSPHSLGLQPIILAHVFTIMKNVNNGLIFGSVQGPPSSLFSTTYAKPPIMN